MIWSAIVGFVLALGGASLGTAAVVLVGFGALKALGEMAFRKHPITGVESPYYDYVEQLRESGGVPRAPRLGYLAQMVLFGTGIGLAVFGVTELVS